MHASGGGLPRICRSFPQLTDASQRRAISNSTKAAELASR